MRLFHTADWHLGKIVHGKSMIEDQAQMLDDLLGMIKEEKPDVMLIAGDIYDRANPPPEAIQLFDRFLAEVVLELGIPVLAVAGNHDSPIRMHFASKLMRDQGFYIIGQLEADQETIVLEDEAGEVHFHLIPYLDPSKVRNLYQDESIHSFDDALQAIIAKIKEKWDPSARHVLLTHFFVTPYGEAKENTSDSERVLSIGGVEYVNADHFKDFHYVALGHLHRAHFVSEPHIRYAGSPLKYSISEENHDKGFYIVDLDAMGRVEVEKRSLIPRRDMRTVKGELEEILQMEPSDDYIFVKLLNKQAVLSPMEKIRTVFPNTLHLETVSHVGHFGMGEWEKLDKKQESDLQLFKAFYKEVKGFPPSEEAVKIFESMTETLLDRLNER